MQLLECTIISPMGLPKNLTEEIRQASEKQGLEADGVIETVSRLIGDDQIWDYLVWEGRGFGQDILRLDIYILGNLHLYNHAFFTAPEYQSAQGVTLLDQISGLSVVSVADEASPYLLVMRMHNEEFARAFATDRERLERFQRNTVAGIQRAKRNGGL